MHKYVVMAHADGPEELAATVTKLVIQHHGDVVTLIVAPDQEPFDFVGVFDIDHVGTEDFPGLDAAIKELPSRDGIQTIRQT